MLLEEHTIDQVQFDAVPLQWFSQMRPRVRPFLDALYSYFNNREHFKTSRRQIADYGLISCEVVLRHPRFLTPRPIFSQRLEIEIPARAR